jgi:hypothetical protein
MNGRSTLDYVRKHFGVVGPTRARSPFVPTPVMGRFHRQVKLAWCLELLGMAVPPQPDTAPDDTDPTPPSNREAMVTPTRVSPDMARAGSSRSQNSRRCSRLSGSRGERLDGALSHERAGRAYQLC